MNTSLRGMKLLGLGLVSVGLLGMGVPAWAADAEGSAAPATYGEGMRTKLGRGLSNMVTAPLELIRTPELVGREKGVFGSLTVGIIDGVWRTLAREVSGAYEIVTFYAELPKGFRPVMRPEYVWINGNWAE